MPKSKSSPPKPKYSLRNRDVNPVVESKVQTTSIVQSKRRREPSSSISPSRPRRGRPRIVSESESSSSSESSESSEVDSDYHDGNQDEPEQEFKELEPESEPEPLPKRKPRKTPIKKTPACEKSTHIKQVISTSSAVGKKKPFFFLYILKKGRQKY